MSVLGIELRRSAALGAAVIVVAAGLITLFATPGRWSDGWMSLALAQREYTILLWPLALAAGAWQGRREHRSKVGDLFASTPRPRLQRMSPVLAAFALVLVGGYLLITAAGLVKIYAAGQYRPLAAFAVVTAVGALSLVAAAWLGLGLGRLMPALATAPALGVAGVLLLLFGTQFAEPEWIAAALSPVHGSSQLHAFQTIAGGVSGAVAVWLIALAATGIVLLAAGNRRTRAAALLPVVLGAAAAIAIVPRDPAVTGTPVDPVARALVCTDDAPKVCVSRVRSTVLDQLTPPARAALAMLNRIPGTPTEVHERTTTYDPDEWDDVAPAGVAQLMISINGRGDLANPQVVVPSLVEGLGIPIGLECDNRSSAIERAAAYYLMGREPRSAVDVYPEVFEEDPAVTTDAIKLWNGLRKLPEAEALARISALRQAILKCQELDGILTRSAR